MTLSYLVDTDWIIHYLNGNRKDVEKLRGCTDSYEEGITSNPCSLK